MTTTTIKVERPKRKRWIAIGVAVVLLLVGFLVVSTLGRIRDNRAALQAQTGDTIAAFIGDLSASATAMMTRQINVSVPSQGTGGTPCKRTW